MRSLQDLSAFEQKGTHMKKTIILIFIFICYVTLNAQIIQPVENDLSIEPPEKSATLAMLMSAIVPGSGQFYVSKNTFTAYLFPLLEIGLWSLKIYLTNNGNEATSDYERYADKFFDIDNQYKVQRNLIYHPNSGKFYGDPETQDLDYWGNGAHFRLKKDDMQHYYEDIGKYSQYTFGWEDWYNTYVEELGGDEVFVNWIFNDATNPYDIRWIGNRPINDPNQIHITKETPYHGSELRDIYVNMRNRAEDYYRYSEYMNFFILANHALAAFDARLTANKHNNNSRKEPALTTFMNTTLIENKLTPIWGVNMKF